MKYITISRLTAFIFDSLVLSIIGYILMHIMLELNVPQHRFWILIGPIISLLYFAVLDSHIGKWRTFGKLILSIKVVDYNGNFLPIHKSLLRAFFILPFILYKSTDPYLPISYFNSFNILFLTLVFIAVYGMGFGVVFFTILDKPGHRGIHDLLTHSIGVRSDEDQIEIYPSNRMIFIIFTIAFLTLAIISITINSIKAANQSKSIQYIAQINSGYPDIQSTKISTENSVLITIYTDTSLSAFEERLPDLINKYQIAKIQNIDYDTCAFYLVRIIDIGIYRQKNTKLVWCKNIQRK